MATPPDKCETTSQTNVNFETTESDTELQSIFRKLRVNRRPKKQPSPVRGVKTTKLGRKATNSGRLPEKHKRRKIVKDATFVFTSTLNKTENRTDRKDLRKDLKPLDELQGCTSSLTSLPNDCLARIQGCGEQFRNAANAKVSNSLNMDDTTPEELAAYFDQLLHIPKPMSQMAEMMYT